MAIDLEAIRKRVAELNGTARSSKVQLWKPGVGEYKVRGLPWKDAKDGVPFHERWFYYIGDGPGILTPHQFGLKDPINDLIRKLYSTGQASDRELAKKLQPKMRTYMPIIVRGQEDKGVQVWSFGKIVYQRLLGFLMDEEVGEFIDPNNGFDLKVVLSQSPGKQFMDTTVDPARRPSKLSDDPELAGKWMSSIPNLDDMYKLKSTEEIEKALNAYLNGDPTPQQVASVGTEKPTVAAAASKTSDELDSLVSELETSSSKKTKKKEKVVDVEQNLDDAFGELISN